MTPYEIGILLHYYARAEDHPDIQRNPPVWRPTIDAFKENGLIEVVPVEQRLVDALYRLTPRGHAYCLALQRVPLPIQAWVMPPEKVSA